MGSSFSVSLSAVFAVLSLGALGLVLLRKRWVENDRAQRAAEAKLRDELEASLRAVKESDERFRLVLSASRDAVWEMDIKRGSVFSSQRAPELFGYTPDEWPPTMAPWERILHPEDAARVRDFAQRFFQGLEPHYDLRFRAVHRDGRTIHCHASAVLVRDAAGAPERLVGFTRDVTEEVEAEANRVQAQKLEGLGLLAGGIAHDFNNILAVISASLELADRQTKEPRVSETLSTATLAVRRAALLTRQLLAYAGRGHLTQRSLDVNELVRSMSALLGVSLKKAVELKQTLAPELPLVRGDDGQLQQVVMNLVTNAAEAIDDAGGVVSVTTRAVTLTAQPPGVVGQVPLGPVVELRVSDTGAGMAPEVLARIFDPFFSTKGTGRGLGLSAIAGILRVHGGGVAIDTAPCRGTTFTVYLPALPQAPQRAPAPTPPPQPPHPGARVLLVDDEKVLRFTTRRLLEVLGCQVDEAASGEEAVARVEATPDGWDLVLMDVTMPGMDGFDATRRIIALAPSLQVVLSSGYAGLDTSQAMPRGVRTLPKPLDVRRLEETLQQVMEARLSAASPSR